MAADPPAVGGQGTDREDVLRQARGAPAVLGAGDHRGHAAPRARVGERTDRRAAPCVRGQPDMTVAVDQELLEYIDRGFDHAVIAFLDDEGYPLSVATGYRVDARQGTIELGAVTDDVAPPVGREVNVIFSHIRPQPNMGYDERRYVSLWGTLRHTATGYELHPDRAQSWDEQQVPFFQYSEITVPQAHAYLDDLGARQGREIRPKLSRGWLFLRATRLPFLSATVVPVGLGTAIAGLNGAWHWWVFLLTLFGAAFVHLGLNVANDVFDTMSGADQANTTPDAVQRRVARDHVRPAHAET